MNHFEASPRLESNSKQQQQVAEQDKMSALTSQLQAHAISAAACNTSQQTSRFLTIPTEIRLQILEELVLFARNEVYEVQMRRLSDEHWERLASRTNRVVHDPSEDGCLQSAIRKVRRHDVSIAVFLVCKQLSAEARDLAYSRNQYLTLVGASFGLLTELKTAGIRQIGIIGKETRQVEDCRPIYQEQKLHPILEIDFGISRGLTESDILVVPFCQVGQVGLALHAMEYDASLESIKLAIKSDTDLIQAYKCSNFDAAKQRLHVDLIQWVGHAVSAVDFARLFIQDSGANPSREILESCRAMVQISGSATNMLRYRQAIIRQQFERAFNNFAADNRDLAYRNIIELDQRITAVVRRYIQIHGRGMSRWRVISGHQGMLDQLYGMLSWILYQMACKPAETDEERRWQPLFAIRASSLWSYEPVHTWVLRTYVKATELLIELRASRLRVLYSLKQIDQHVRSGFRLPDWAERRFGGHYFRVLRDGKVGMPVEEMPISEAEAASMLSVLATWKDMMVELHGPEPRIDPPLLEGYEDALALHPQRL